MTFADEIRSARRAARLTQAALSRRAGTSQSRLSTYEKGTIVPHPATRIRLLRATRRLPSEIVDEQRHRIIAVGVKYGLSNVRVFGSVARLEDSYESDIDLLVTPGPETSLLDLAGFVGEVEDLTGRRVDVVSDRTVPGDSAIRRDALAL